MGAQILGRTGGKAESGESEDAAKIGRWFGGHLEGDIATQAAAGGLEGVTAGLGRGYRRRRRGTGGERDPGVLDGVTRVVEQGDGDGLGACSGGAIAEEPGLNLLANAKIGSRNFQSEARVIPVAAERHQEHGDADRAQGRPPTPLP